MLFPYLSRLMRNKRDIISFLQHRMSNHRKYTTNYKLILFTINSTNLVKYFHTKTKLLSFIFHIMAFSVHILFIIVSVLIFFVLNPAQSATSSDTFIHSRAAYYPNSDDKGSESEKYVI